MSVDVSGASVVVVVASGRQKPHVTRQKVDTMERRSGFVVVQAFCARRSAQFIEKPRSFSTAANTPMFWSKQVDAGVEAMMLFAARVGIRGNACPLRMAEKDAWPLVAMSSENLSRSKSLPELEDTENPNRPKALEGPSNTTPRRRGRVLREIEGGKTRGERAPKMT